MKKSKLSITLVTSFIAAMALTACNEVTKSDKAIVTFTPYGTSESIDLITNDVYNKYRGTNSGVSMFYDKILEVLIRYEFKDKGFDKGELKYSEIEDWADNQVQEQKDKAKANAKSNKTSYKDEWESILESFKVEDEAELKEHFIYDKEKEVMTNWYSGDNQKAEELKSEFIGIDKNGAEVTSDVKAAMPYHVRHILVKVDEATDAQAKFYKGTITEAQAKLLSDTVSSLASGKYKFAQVASTYSEDGSASSGGDVGIMTNTATSGSLGMVNEFQLGIYAYDNIYNAAHAADGAKDTIRKGLGITDDVVNALPAEVARVPYDAFIQIGKTAEVTADKFGNKLANGSTALYPRNILWNKYLNLHNVFVITNKERGGNKFGAADAQAEFANLEGANVDANVPVVDANVKATKFKDGVLVDENDNVIIGVRSQYGIHFMVIEKSMYEYADDGLVKYYSTKLPGEKAKFEGDYDYVEDSYVGYIVSQSTEDYKKRADDVRSKITTFDSTYDYRLYKWLQTEMTINFTGIAEGLGEEIDSYIKALQKNNAYKQEDGLDKVWRTYNELLDVQDFNRNAKFNIVTATGGSYNNLTRLVSEKAADDFLTLYEGGAGATAAVYDLFAEGGVYYYYA